MRIPWIVQAAIASQVLPPLAALRYGRRLPSARRWIFLWAVLLLAYDLTQVALLRRGQHNLWLRYPFGPIEAGVVLVALSLWHGDSVARLALRVAVRQPSRQCSAIHAVKCGESWAGSMGKHAVPRPLE